MAAVDISHQPQGPVGFMSTPIGTQSAPPAGVSTMGSGIPAVSPPVAGISTVNVAAQYPLSTYPQGSVLAGVSGEGALQQQVIDDVQTVCG